MTAIEIYLDKTLRERWSFVKRRVSLDLVKHIIAKYQDGPRFRYPYTKNDALLVLLQLNLKVSEVHA